jgi:glycosyltransferase involved in cell wall biosynthesis
MADAMQKLLKTRDDIKILCLGNVIYSPHVEELRAYLKENNLDKHILMPGFYPEVEAFYASVDAFLLPSFIEGWSIAMNEAMFYEKPMILSDTGASAEVIENSDIGILIENEYGDTLNLDSALLDSTAYDKRDYDTSKNLAAAMENFADNREYWKEAGKKGLRKVVKFLNFDKIVRRYEDVFKTTLENK